MKNLLQKKSRRMILWGAGLLLAAALGFWGISSALDPYDCRILEGVTIGGVEVGGMTRRDARKALHAALEESLYAQSLTVTLPKEALSLSPEDTNVKVNIRKAVNAAYQYGRSQTQSAAEISLLPYLKLDEESVRTRLAEYAASYDTELSQPKWELTGTLPELSTDRFDPSAPGQTLLLTVGIPKVQLDIDQVYGEILAAYNKGIFLCAEGLFSVTPEVQPEAFPEEIDLGQLYQQTAVAPVDDALDMETYEFVPGAYGWHFDLEAAEKALSEADWGETLSLPMTAVEPDILGDEVYFRDVLGSCETRHTNDENRNTNLRLLCQTLDGLILQPGETFSYNDTLGERTEEKGYKPANAYSGNRLVKDIGGGVCQGSTTLYNCALLADLEILERVCHGVKVGYVPLGLDAAVNWATQTDLKFRNNFHFPVKIQAEVSEGYVKMQILGTDEKDYYIEMHCGVGEEGTATYAVSYKYKYSKETGELLSKDVEARSAYYTLSE